jgi:hypothetical protein
MLRWQVYLCSFAECSFLIVMDDIGRSRDGLYENTLADSEREAVAELLRFLENVRRLNVSPSSPHRYITTSILGWA